MNSRYRSIFPLLAAALSSFGQTKAPVYHIYSGNTHAHTSVSASHGAQLKQTPGEKKYLFIDSNSVGHAINSELRPDWQKYQGSPAVHFDLAKKQGYDFYIVTDHSQEEELNPPSPVNKTWVETHEAAKKSTDKNFTGLVGYEHSENDGPGAKGHINIINSRSYLNALKPGVDIQYLYKWLDTVSAYENGPVVGTFNHPGKDAFDNWAYRDSKVTDVLTMLEVLNSNNHVHYDAFVAALDAGWKVSPVAGNDNHGTGGIGEQKSRTFVLATGKSKLEILDAMKNRRTYASLDNNIQCQYTVNGAIMGSTLNKPGTFAFDIQVSDPDTEKESNKITRIDIVTDKGKVVETYNPAPSFDVTWKPTIKDADNKFYFIRVWNAGGGDAPKADPANPVAWLAPVWTGR